MSMTPEGAIMKGRMKLRSDYPFAGDALIYMRPEADPSVGTMGVDKEGVLYYAPDFTMSLTFDQLCVVLIHEVLHILLQHPFRMPIEVKEAVKNGIVTAEASILKQAHAIAIDIKVNYMFHEMGLFQHLPGDCIKPTSYGEWSETFTDYKGGQHRVCIQKCQERTVESLTREIADFLRKIPKPPGGGGKGVRRGTGHGSGSGSGSGDEPMDDTGGSGNGTGNHDGWFKDLDPGKEAESSGDWLIRAAGILNSSSVGKGKGTIPASLARELGVLLDPVIDWRGRLQQFIQPIVAMDYSYRRPRRTSWVTGTILPGQDKGGIKLIAHVDTSGSMRKKELEQITGELYGILDSYPYVEVLLLHSDAGTPEVLELRSSEKDDIVEMLDKQMKGGGGTSHRPVVKWVLDNNEEQLEALLCFTDGLSDIEYCFDDLQGEVARLLFITRKDQVDHLEKYAEDCVYLPCD
jgi:predicted metal-dependent peptidase